MPLAACGLPIDNNDSWFIECAKEFIEKIWFKITELTGETQFLFQRLSVMIGPAFAYHTVYLSEMFEIFEFSS